MAKLHKVLKSFAEQRGITVDENSNILLLKQKDYAVSIRYQTDSSYYVGGLVGALMSARGGANAGLTAAVPLEADQYSKENAAALKQAFKEVAVVVFIKTQNILELRIKSGVKTETSVDRLNAAINILDEQIPLLGLKVRQNCFFCQQPNCDDMVENEGVHYPAHNRCKKEQAYQIAKEIDENITGGNYGLAILCAVLGGIVGSVPSILALALADYLVAFLFAVIPLAAHFGYRKGKGIMSMATPFLIALISVICTVLIIGVTVYYQISREFGEALPIPLFFELLTYPDLFRIVTAQFIQALIFTALGLFISWKFINTNNREKLAKAKALSGGMEDKPAEDSSDEEGN